VNSPYDQLEDVVRMRPLRQGRPDLRNIDVKRRILLYHYPFIILDEACLLVVLGVGTSFVAARRSGSQPRLGGGFRLRHSSWSRELDRSMDSGLPWL
jgi:hypothetical protein